MFFHSSRPASSAAAIAPANAMPLTPPPSKTASALGGIRTSAAPVPSCASSAVLTAQTYELRRRMSSENGAGPANASAGSAANLGCRTSSFDRASSRGRAEPDALGDAARIQAQPELAGELERLLV